MDKASANDCICECFNSNETMSLNDTDKELLKRISKQFDSEPVYNDNKKHINLQTKSYGYKLNKIFQGK